jgi:PAS domain S-box-containing protein
MLNTTDKSGSRATLLFDEHRQAIFKRIDRLFLGLLFFEWIASIVVASVLSPKTWDGASASVHMHIYQAVFFGALLMSLPTYLVSEHSGKAYTRNVIAIAQMLMCGLLIQFTNGRLESHFSIFGSLAFLAFYRDWRVLVTASIVVTVDHLFRGLFWPQSIFGVTAASPLRTLEHAAWVVFEDIFLIQSCIQSTKEMRRIADRQAELEDINESIEIKIADRTAELQQSKERLKAIFEGAVDGILAIDTDGTIESINPAFERMFGYSDLELVGKNASILAPQDSVFSHLLKGIEKSIHAPVEINLTSKTGVSVPVEISVSEVRLENRLFYSAIVRDIRERKEVELRVREFYSTVSHELRTPLTSIRGALGLVEGGMVGEVSSDILEMVTIARGNADRLIRLINDILDLRKIEEGKLELRVTEFSASKLVTKTLSEIKGFADERKISLRSNLLYNPVLSGDADRILQVLTNLISNAVKFSDPGKFVDIIVSESASGITRFSVVDKGIGIPAEQMHKLFGKFQQLDSSDVRKTEGTGLGLAISKAIIEHHGGTIGVDSVVGKGTTFWFELKCLPKVEVRDDEKLAPELNSRAVLADAHRSSAGSILIVEDDKELCAVLKKMLMTHGYGCVAVESIAEADAFLAEATPSLIILDLNLPDGDGRELLVRLQDGTRRIPVIIMTGSDRDNSLVSPMLIDWLAKPFDHKSLCDSVEKAVLKPKRPSVLLIEDDASTRKIVGAHLASINVDYIEACDGAVGIMLARTCEPDLIILDLNMPRPDGFELVSMLRGEKAANTPLIVFTGKDLTNDERLELTLGVTMHLTKSASSMKDFLDAVQELLVQNAEPAAQISAEPVAEIKAQPVAEICFAPTPIL